MLSTVQVEGPDLARFDALLVLDAELVDHVVVSAGEEGSLLLDDLKSPCLTIEVGLVHELLVSSVDIDSLDLTIVVTDKDLAVKKIER